MRDIPTHSTPPDGDIASTGRTFGQLLRGEREDRGMSLAELAEATHVHRHHLEALERDDFASLPGDVFVRGYLRTCAKSLGVEADLMIADYERQKAMSGQDGDVIEKMSRVLHVDEATRRRRRMQIVAGGVALVVVVGGAWWWLQGRGAGEGTVAVAAATPEPEPMPVANPERDVEAAEVSPPAKAPVEVEEVVERAAPPKPARVAPEITIEPMAPARIATPEPEPEPVVEVAAPAPTPSTTAPATDLVLIRVTEFGVGTDIVNRELVGQGDRFAAGSRVVFWTRVLDGQAGDTIDHVWLRNGLEQDRMTLRIGASHWRTQSKKTLYGAAGDWAAEARDASGRLLARSEFTTRP